jgi:hypothetical protein
MPFLGIIFIDASLVIGWRQEEQNLRDGVTLNGFYGRVWIDAGWLADISARSFINLRGSAGLIPWRTDAHGRAEKKVQPEMNIEVGIRF